VKIFGTFCKKNLREASQQMHFCRPVFFATVGLLNDVPFTREENLEQKVFH
jgi:hypothetical protein